MGLVFVNDIFAVDPDEVVSLESFEHWKNGSSISHSPILDCTGTIVIQKNGRKTYVKHLDPKRCHDLIFGKIVGSKKEMQTFLPGKTGVSKDD